MNILRMIKQIKEKRKYAFDCNHNNHVWRQNSYTYIDYEPADTVEFKCIHCGKKETRDNLYLRCKNPKCNYEVYRPTGVCTKCGKSV